MLLLVAGAIVGHPQSFLQVRGLTKGERSMDKWHLNIDMVSGHPKASCCACAADYMDMLGASKRDWGLIEGYCLKSVCFFMSHVRQLTVGWQQRAVLMAHMTGQPKLCTSLTMFMSSIRQGA